LESGSLIGNTNDIFFPGARTNPFYKYDGVYSKYQSNFVSGCRNGFYGEHCEKSYLLDLFNNLCLDCVPNQNSWIQCFNSSSCYCNNQTSLFNNNQRIECDQYNEITSIKLSNMNLTGTLKNLTDFFELKFLDISNNAIQMNNSFHDILPLSIETINMTGNNLYYPSSLFEINSTKFTNFKQLYLENTQVCGIYPQSWVRSPNFKY